MGKSDLESLAKNGLQARRGAQGAVEADERNTQELGSVDEIAMTEMDGGGALVVIKGKSWGAFVPGIVGQRDEFVVMTGGEVRIDEGQVRRFVRAHGYDLS